MHRYASFSLCRTYRYALWRTWQTDAGVVLFVGLNPSTADETSDDPTIRRCVRFARDWGYGGMCIANLFAFRATHPRDLLRAPSPIGPDNDHWLGHLAETAALVVAAWGNHGVHGGRASAVRQMLGPIHCLRMTGSGQPAHPLYLPATLIPQPWPADQ